MKSTPKIDASELQLLLHECGAKGYYHDADDNWIFILEDGSEIKLPVLIQRERTISKNYDIEAEYDAPKWVKMKFREMRKKVRSGTPVPEKLRKALIVSSEHYGNMMKFALLSKYKDLDMIPREFPMSVHVTKGAAPMQESMPIWTKLGGAGTVNDTRKEIELSKAANFCWNIEKKKNNQQTRKDITEEFLKKFRIVGKPLYKPEQLAKYIYTISRGVK